MSDLPAISSAGAPSAAPQSYEEFLEDIKGRIRSARARAARAINAELIEVYWQIGKEIERRQIEAGPERGRKTPGVIQRLSADLRTAFPGVTGFSPANLARMRSFAVAWPDEAGLAHGVQDLPWGTSSSWSRNSAAVTPGTGTSSGPVLGPERSCRQT
jgi:hypothetical protein